MANGHADPAGNSPDVNDTHNNDLESYFYVYFLTVISHQNVRTKPIKIIWPVASSCVSANIQ